MAWKDVAEIEGMDELLQKLEKLLLIDPEGIGEALMEGGLLVEKEAQANVRKRGLVSSGDLERSIEAQKDGKDVVIGTSLGWRARIHEFGGTITAKRAPFLMFKVGADWKKVKRVTIPARPFMRPALLDNTERVVRKVGDVLLVEIRKKVGG